MSTHPPRKLYKNHGLQSYAICAAAYTDRNPTDPISNKQAQGIAIRAIEKLRTAMRKQSDIVTEERRWRMIAIPPKAPHRPR